MIKWLGHDVLEQHPIVRMLHENRAEAAAAEKLLPLQDRPSYRIRQQRIFARGRGSYADDNRIATRPDEAPAEAAAVAEAPVAPGETTGAPTNEPA